MDLSGFTIMEGDETGGDEDEAKESPGPCTPGADASRAPSSSGGGGSGGGGQEEGGRGRRASSVESLDDEATARFKVAESALA